MNKLKNYLRGSKLYEWYWIRKQVRHVSQTDEGDIIRRNLYESLVPRGSLCFDIGANIGMIAKLLLSMDARVVACEPQRRCIEVLKRTLGSNPKFHLIEAAVGATQGKADFYQSINHYISSMNPQWIDAMKSSVKKDAEWTKPSKVDVVDLKSLLKQFGVPYFIKIDVEGFEWEVIRGLDRPVNLLSFEFSSWQTEIAGQCIDHLASLPGSWSFNYSRWGSEPLKLDTWIDARGMKEFLASQTVETRAYGDVFARCDMPATN